MRILLISANFRPHVGGIERFTEILADGLADRNHEVTVVACRFAGARTRETAEGFEVQRLPSSYSIETRFGVPYPLPSPRALTRELRAAVNRADVVHVQDAVYATSVAALVQAHRRQTASVLTQHVAFVPQRSRALDAAQHVAHATLGRCARLATRVATYNPAVAAWARKRWNLADVRVLPVGIRGPAEEPVDRSEMRRSFGLPPDRMVALFVGRDVPKKGLDIFLAAHDPAYELAAVTDRPGLTAEATVIPFMSPDRLMQLLCCVDAFVLPSEAEGLPLSLQEALAAGLPVVTTHQEGYDQFLAPEDVLYVDRDPGDVRRALLRLASDRDLRASLSTRARSAAKLHFGVKAFADAYEALYEEARSAREGTSAGLR